jgi:uncharacterized Zn ribbon protein
MEVKNSNGNGLQAGDAVIVFDAFFLEIVAH